MRFECTECSSLFQLLSSSDPFSGTVFDSSTPAVAFSSSLAPECVASGTIWCGCVSLHSSRSATRLVAVATIEEGSASVTFPSDPNLPPDDFQGRDLDAPGDSQRRPVRHSAHGKSAKLGKTHTQVPPSIVSFDWGPLPKAKPMSTLPADLRPVGSSKNE